MRRQNKSSQRHPVQLPVIFWIFGGNQQLMRVERDPHGLTDLARQLHGGEEIHIVNIKSHLPGLHRIVELRGYPVSSGELREQAAHISVVMESCPVIPW